MKTMRVTSSNVIKYLAGKVQIADPMVTEEQALNFIKTLHDTQPDNIFTYVIIDGTDIACYISAVFCTNHVKIISQWSNKEMMNSVYSQVLMYRVLQWAELKGVKNVRIDTVRNEDAIERRFGFKKLFSTMEYVIPDNFDADIVFNSASAFLKKG